MEQNQELEDDDLNFGGRACDSAQYFDSESEDNMIDFGEFNPYGIMGDMCDGVFNEVYNGGSITGFGGDMFDPMNDQHHAMEFGLPDGSCSVSIDDGHDSAFDRNEIDSDRGYGTCTKGLPQEVFRKVLSVKRHLSILRLNHQIYDEASLVLHSHLTIAVNPGDALTDTPGNAIVSQSKIWRHAPSKELKYSNINGETVYDALPLDGFMEPHVFARFQKISYTADFDFGCDDAAPSLYISDDLSVRASDAAKFISYLKTTTKHSILLFGDPLPAHRFDNRLREEAEDTADVTVSRVTDTQPSTADVFQKFVDLLSNSPFIRHLEFILRVEVRREGSIRYSSSDSEDEVDSVQVSRDIEKEEAADERATELMLESGVLDCLQELSNVKSFSLRIATYGCGGKTMTPQKKHLNIMEDLKKTVERNWAIKHGLR